MGESDASGSLFNYFVYDGEQVINPESLEELDAREIDVLYGGEKGEKQPVQYPLCDAGKKYGLWCPPDHLLPVVTLVIYFDSKEWDGLRNSLWMC